MTRKGNFITLAILALVLGHVSANLIGFDLGSTFFKITVVQPGKQFEIVENETSLRKTQSQFTVTPEQRLFGKDSFTGNSRYPKQTFADLMQYFGMEYDAQEMERVRLEEFVLNDFVADDRGLVAMQSFAIGDKKSTDDEPVESTTFYTEELVATLLKYGRNLAEKTAGGKVTEAVITVPSYFTQEQRLMLIDAAELAGLNVNQLIHENTAAATLFGIDNVQPKEDEGKERLIMFYNMGGRDTEVSLVRYNTISNAKNKTYEAIEILGEGWDKTLGG
jgi:hypoxia up-regulated 1